MKLISILALALGATVAQAVTIDAVYFGQTHVLKASDPYFGLVGNREALIKVHVTDPATPASPPVTATLTLTGQAPLVLTLMGPATLPASIPDGLGVVQHSFSNTFTGYIPAAWVKKGLQITVNAGAASTSLTNLDIGAPTKVVMTMFDVQYFADTNDNYPANSFAEVEAKWPVSDLEVRRLGHVVFPELVIPPRTDVGTKAVRIKSKTEYEVQTGLAFDGEQAAALAWNGALKRAAGRSGRWTLYYVNVYNAFAGGQAGGFAGVGSGTSVGILHHELGHALSLPHWGDSAAYPYKGDMHGISAPSNYNGTHSGPAWAFDLRTKAFIPPTVQTGNAGGKPVGTYKVDPMQGGGTGYQEPAYLMNHFSDYSMNQMRDYLHGHVVVWNPALNSWAQWNQTAGDYTTTVTNNGVQFPTTRDTQVISIMASISGSDPGVTMVYPPIGPYTSGLIRLFDPTVAADRTAAQSTFSPTNGSDLCVRVLQGGVKKTYMLAASWLTTQDPYSSGSLVTEAVNIPASGGAVTKIELLLTPNAEDVGLPANPQVLSTWAPLMPDPASFESPPVAFGSSAVTMKATAGELAFGYTGTVEYLFTETTGNPGGTTSAWQTSRSYTDIGLNPGVQYSYTVSMRAGTQATTASSPAAATTFPAPAAAGVTVNSTQQFSLQSGSGLKSVTGLGTFNAGTADKLVVVISTEDANNAGIGFVYDVRYNGKVMTEAIQEDAGAAAGTAAIFYLDNPGAIGSGTIQVSAENPNGGIGCAYALSNTMPGFGASNSRTGETASSMSLTTAGDGSVVIAVLDNAGKPNSSGTPTATTTSPSLLTQASSGMWGSQWGGHASGYRLVTSPTAITPAFTTLSGSGYSINIAAVEFPAQPPLPNLWIQTAGNAQSWTTAANWDDGVVPNPASGATMDFSSVNIAANTTLNLGANRSARLWKFGDTSGSQRWTVSAGHTLTLAGTTPGFQINNGTTQIDAAVEGSAGLAKTGAGNLTLTASNTYTGATTITAGTLQIGNGSTTGSLAASSAITNDAALVFNRTNAITQGTDFASLIAGTGSLAMNGSGTLILSGDNTYAGTTTITAGTLQIGSGGTTGKLSTTSAITNNAALVFNRSNGIVQGLGFANAISGTGSLSNTGIGALTLNVGNTYSGLTTISAGSIKVLNPNALGTTAAGTVVNGTTTGSTANARLELEGGITVTGETLTLNGVGNFYGALSSTNGSNTWAGNVTIGSAGTRLGTTTGTTLTVSGIIDSGAVETGLIVRTQDLTSTVVLSGANTYLGDTNVLIGKLQLDGGDHRLPVTSRLTMGSTTSIAELDLNGMDQEISGLALNSGANAANNSVSNSSLTVSTLTVNTASPSTFGGVLKGNFSLVKAGAETLTLSGLSATAANNHTGTSIIGAGTLAISANNPSFTGGLTFGSANGSATPGAMTLSSSSATYAGLALVRTNSTTANAISIGAGRTLTLNGGLTLGYDAGAGTGQTNSRLTVTGSGSMAVNGTTITIGLVQAGVNLAYSNKGTLDVSGLAAFNTNVTDFNLGATTSGNTQGVGDLFLSNTANTFLATTLTVGNTGSNNGYGASTLILGTGSNIIQADTINIGRNKGSGPGVVKFASQTPGSPGTLTLANKIGAGRANIDIANQLGNATSGGAVGTLDLRGHASTVSAGTVTIGSVTAAGAGGPNGSLSFDAGTFDVNALNLAPKTGSSTGTSRATLNVGGGSFTVNTAFTLGSQTGGGFSAATLNLTGGTLTSHVDIVGGGGATTSTLTLNGPGAILDMTGDDITDLDGITFTAGTLRNLGVANTGMALAGTGSRIFDQGAGVSGSIQGAVTGPAVGLTKQGAGTLTLSSINTYTGDTTVNAGTFALADNAQLNFVTGTTSGTNNRITGTGTVTIDGDFNIDTTLTDASPLTTGTWTIVDAAALTEAFGTTFSLTGPGWTEVANVWTKTVGSKKYTFTEATGILNLDPAASYASWINGFFPGETNLSIIGADADPDNDSIENGVEMVIGGNPKLGMDTALLPTLELVTNPIGSPAIAAGNYLLFTYRRSDLATAAGVTADCGTNTALIAPWTPATGAPGVVIQVDDNFAFTPPAAAATDRVRIYVPRGANPKLFARMKVLLP